MGIAVGKFVEMGISGVSIGKVAVCVDVGAAEGDGGRAVGVAVSMGIVGVMVACIVIVGMIVVGVTIVCVDVGRLLDVTVNVTVGCGMVDEVVAVWAGAI